MNVTTGMPSCAPRWGENNILKRTGWIQYLLAGPHGELKVMTFVHSQHRQCPNYASVFMGRPRCAPHKSESNILKRTGWIQYLIVGPSWGAKSDQSVELSSRECWDSRPATAVATFWSERGGFNGSCRPALGSWKWWQLRNFHIANVQSTQMSSLECQDVRPAKARATFRSDRGGFNTFLPAHSGDLKAVIVVSSALCQFPKCTIVITGMLRCSPR